MTPNSFLRGQRCPTCKPYKGENYIKKCSNQEIRNKYLELFSIQFINKYNPMFIEVFNKLKGSNNYPNIIDCLINHEKFIKNFWLSYNRLKIENPIDHNKNLCNENILNQSIEDCNIEINYYQIIEYTEQLIILLREEIDNTDDPILKKIFMEEIKSEENLIEIAKYELDIQLKQEEILLIKEEIKKVKKDINKDDNKDKIKLYKKHYDNIKKEIKKLRANIKIKEIENEIILIKREINNTNTPEINNLFKLEIKKLNEKIIKIRESFN
jgi:hypothetical protein